MLFWCRRYYNHFYCYEWLWWPAPVNLPSYYDYHIIIIIIFFLCQRLLLFCNSKNVSYLYYLLPMLSIPLQVFWKLISFCYFVALKLSLAYLITIATIIIGGILIMCSCLIAINLSIHNRVNDNYHNCRNILFLFCLAK